MKKETKLTRYKSIFVAAQTIIVITMLGLFLYIGAAIVCGIRMVGAVEKYGLKAVVERIWEGPKDGTDK